MKPWIVLPRNTGAQNKIPVGLELPGSQRLQPPLRVSTELSWLRNAGSASSGITPELQISHVQWHGSKWAGARESSQKPRCRILFNTEISSFRDRKW